MDLSQGGAVGALLTNRVLGRQHEEGLGQLALPTGGDGGPLHRLEQRGLYDDGVRLISSASTTFAKSGPASKRKGCALVSGSMCRSSVPVMSVGIRSGVNWILLKDRSIVFATGGSSASCEAGDADEQAVGDQDRHAGDGIGTSSWPTMTRCSPPHLAVDVAEMHKHVGRIERGPPMGGSRRGARRDSARRAGADQQEGLPTERGPEGSVIPRARMLTGTIGERPAKIQRSGDGATDDAATRPSTPSQPEHAGYSSPGRRAASRHVEGGAPLSAACLVLEPCRVGDVDASLPRAVAAAGAPRLRRRRRRISKA